MSDRSQRILTLLKYIVILFAAVSVVLFYYQCIRNINKFAKIDLTSYIQASDCFFNGCNPYVDASRRYIYPLFLLLVVYPLRFLMSSPLLKGLAAAVWSAAEYLALFYTVAGIWKHVYGGRFTKELVKQLVLPFCLIVVMLHPSLQDEFLNGQVNLLVLGAVGAFFLLMERNQMFWSAVVLAAASSVKISPALCLLYPLLTGRYRVMAYFIPLTALFAVGIPWLVNSNSLGYYQYFVSTVMPSITGSDFTGGFRSFSVISTLSYLFHIAWYPPVKIAAVCILAAALCAPIVLYGRAHLLGPDRRGRLLVLAAIMAVIPLTFPMSEAHHLLLLTIPFIAIIMYWSDRVARRETLHRDWLAILFAVCVLGLHIGHGLKDTPIRLLSLIGIYAGMTSLLRRSSRADVTPT